MTATATTMPAEVQQFIDGVLEDLGVTPTATAVDGFGIWLENEQGPGWTAFLNNKGNPLGIQTSAAQAAGKTGNMAEGIKLTAALLKTAPYAGIVDAFKSAKSTDDIAKAIMSSDWSGVNRPGEPNGYTAKGLNGFLNPGGASGAAASTPGQVNLTQVTNSPPVKGADIKDFGGFDLSAFKNSPLLGDAEKLIEQYNNDPAFRAKVQKDLTSEYGYSTDWWSKIPQVQAVMIYASQNLDPTSASSKNLFLGLLRNTQWWQTTNANQRAWDQAYGANGAPGSDPAQARQQLGDAQEKVLADANQIGVTLTKQQLDQIALMYAQNTYVQSGSIGSQSGTAAEWLDQAIIDTIENVSGQKVGNLPTDFSGQPAGTNDFTAIANQIGTSGAALPTTTTGAGANGQSTQDPTGLFGIAAQLYDAAQQIAQQYLMYNPSSPNGGLINNEFLLQQVQQTLLDYTGSGSSFGSSNLINGFEAAFTETMKNMASQYYPSLAGSIAQGVTPQNYVQPYTQLITNMTGIDGASIDYTSPKWSWILGTPDPKTGVKTALTPDQVQQKLVTMPVWQNSNNAQVLGSDVVTNLNREFGFGGT